MTRSKSGVWKNPKHGTPSGYAQYKCRCEECREWNKNAARRARAKNPDYFRKYAREWYNLHPQAARRDKVLRKYGITLEQYNSLLAKQGGICAICGKAPREDGYLSIDHDHACCAGQKSCGKCIRGLLCANCNSILGLANDKHKTLDQASQYLKTKREYVPEGFRKVAD